jgi:asparagine N-glycosylation enzyme membrane subunit Stt3
VVAGLAAAAWLPKTVRFTAALEPAIAVLAAAGLAAVLAAAADCARRGLLLVSALFGLGVGSWAIFARVFLERRVYDPTTFDLVTALDAIPHAGPMAPGTLAAPLVVIVVVAVALAVTLGVRTPAP